MSQITAILHVSDIECGHLNRAENAKLSRSDPYGECATYLVNDARDRLEENGIRLDRVVLVITGDVAYHALHDEYVDAEIVVSTIQKGLGIPPERTVVVPGNHDVSWDACRAQFGTYTGLANTQDNRRKKLQFFTGKQTDFGIFFEHATGRVWHGPGSVVTYEELLPLGIAVVGFDTTTLCTFEEDDNSGLLFLDDLKPAKGFLEKSEKAGGDRFKIAVMHHCPNPAADLTGGKVSYMLNGEEARDKLADAGFVLVLCGHEHRPVFVENIRRGDHTFVAGCYGLDPIGLAAKYLGSPRPLNNRYQLILLNPDGNGECMLRALARPGELDAPWDEDILEGPSHFPFHCDFKPPVRGSIKTLAGPHLIPFKGVDRWLVPVAIEATPETIERIKSVTYRIADQTSENRRNAHEAFGAVLEISSLTGEIVANIEYKAGHRGPQETAAVPLPPVKAEWDTRHR